MGRLTSSSFSTPLLAKELIEQAARSRTYIVRTIYALALLGLFVFFLWGTTGMVPAGAVDSFGSLGAGRIIFERFLSIQIFAIYLMVPLLTAGAIAREKERGSLELLLITGLTPRQIIVEKMLSRSLPMIMFVMLALPPTALAYTYGGLSPVRLAATAVGLIATILFVASLAVMLSAHSRTTNTALARTYVYMVLIPIAAGIVGGLLSAMLPEPVNYVTLSLTAGCVPWFLTYALGKSGIIPLSFVIGSVLGALVWTGFFLLYAEKFLLNRAFLPKGKRKRRGGVFAAFLPARLSRARSRHERLKGRGCPRGNDPISWRELSRATIGSHKGFVRAVVTIGAILAFISLVSLATPDSPAERVAPPATWIFYILFLIAVPGIGINSADAISTERSNQTLDALLATPLSGEDIMDQKAAWASRISLFVSILMCVPIAFQALWYGLWMFRRGAGLQAGRDLGMLLYLATMLVVAPLFLAAVSWVARWIGLRVHARDRSAVATVVALFVWWVGPIWLTGLWRSWMPLPLEGILALASPMRTISLAQGLAQYGFQGDVALGVAAGLALHLGVALLARRVCRRNADRLLGRAVGPVDAPPMNAGDGMEAGTI
jgi:ABC-type transport system involved in multi-copper enzyme maturation permease subunit